jgi:3-hydroxyacyl-[acyl-carrier protein] dehydratase/trans-2-decenoyl-[acyl-carrier protein] isomerase
MSLFPTSFDRDDAAEMRAGRACSAPATPNCRRPPMLMMDRITDISEDGASMARAMWWPSSTSPRTCGSSTATFPGNPIMPGCLGLDGLWQLTGFNLGWRGWQGRGYALGVGEVKLTGMVRPDRKKLTYYVDFTKAIADPPPDHGRGRWPGGGRRRVIYLVKDMKVALSAS